MLTTAPDAKPEHLKSSLLCLVTSLFSDLWLWLGKMAPDGLPIVAPYKEKLTVPAHSYFGANFSAKELRSVGLDSEFLDRPGNYYLILADS